MLKSIKLLKKAAISYKPVPNEFSILAPESTPLQKLSRIYASKNLHEQLHHTAVQHLVFGTKPPAPPSLLKYAPQKAIPLAIRSYLYSKDLDSAFKALEYLKPKSHSYQYLTLFGLGLGSGLIWTGPVGVFLAIFWSGLGIVTKTPQQYRYVQWRPQVPFSSRDEGKIASCDHIVAWYEDHIGVTTENWHRHGIHDPVSELVLTRHLAEFGLERAPRRVDYEYADYWTHRDDFNWQEPDQDPIYFRKRGS